jgi:hypothetical protein
MRLSASDALVSTGVAAGVCALLWLFAVDIGTISIRANEKALGTVVFKKMTATRRPSDGLGWERMRNNSPVYNADTLRTGDLSEAAIYFDDGTSLDLEANSMLKLDFGGVDRNLEFLNGEITVGGSKNGSSYVISSKAGTITVGAESSATFSRDEKNNVVGVEVNKGTATLTRVDGTKQTVQENQAIEVSTTDGSAKFVSRPIVPLKPERNARVLSLADAAAGVAGGTAGTGVMSFQWKLEADKAGAAQVDSGANAKFTLEISASKNFDDRLMQMQVTGIAAEVPITAGTWYWRVRDEAGKESPVRKFSFSVETLPRPAFPDDGASYRYRKTKPEIRFAWTGMEDATAYLFELSDNAQFSATKIRTRVAGTNFSVGDLGEGTWHWRVKPVHGFTEVRGSEDAAVRTITIEKSGAMAKPDSTTPFEGMLYQIQDIEGKGLAFAWLPQVEAVSYELVVSAKQDLSTPALIAPSTTPYIKLTGAAGGALAKAGTWYWGVRWLDREGNRSPDSAARKIIGVDGSIAIRSVFPPAGYRIADSLASNTRFSWKSNIAAKTVFVVARDADFTDTVFQEIVSADTMLGKAWPAGNYWWKVKTFNADNSLFLETPARAFTIVEPLRGPGILSPNAGTPFYLREGDSIELKWNLIPGADYYTIAVYSPKDSYANAVFERTHITGDTAKMVLGDFPTGAYLVKVQGFALASDTSTRVIGYIGETYLAYHQLGYLVLDGTDNATYDGLEALRRGVTLQYSTENAPESQEFILWKGSQTDGSEIARSTDLVRAFTKKKLGAGEYFWTVKGMLANFDISARNIYRFKVLPIPPLPATTLVEPAKDAIYGVAEIRASREITFSWLPVDGANRYALSIYPEGSDIPTFTRDDIAGTSYTLQDLASLSRGKNVWKVEARSYGSDGEMEQPGTPSESAFVIDLPAVKRATSKTGNTLYGR